MAISTSSRNNRLWSNFLPLSPSVCDVIDRGPAFSGPPRRSLPHCLPVNIRLVSVHQEQDRNWGNKASSDPVRVVLLEVRAASLFILSPVWTGFLLLLLLLLGLLSTFASWKLLTDWQEEKGEHLQRFLSSTSRFKKKKADCCCWGALCAWEGGGSCC